MRADPSSPITVRLKPKYINTCGNKDLKDKKEFTVDRIVSKADLGDEDDRFDWDFRAVFDGIKMSTLNANNGGKCDLVTTKKSYMGCGLATTLMEFCFEDEKVGGYNVENDRVMNRDSMKKWREMAKENCKKVIFLKCTADPLSACSGYLTAAINTKHTMMFSYAPKVGFHVMKVENSKTEFKKAPKKWTDEYGDIWYFCKCKPERKADCEAMM